MNAIGKIPILWELLRDSTEEQITTVVATRVEEPEAMEEDAEDEYYINQEEPKEMEMEIEELGEEAAPQEQGEIVESMADMGIVIERSTRTILAHGTSRES